MVEAIVFDWIGTLYERNRGLFTYSESILKKLKQKYKLGLVTKAGDGIEIRRNEIEASGVLSYFDSVIIDILKTEKQFLECIKEMKTIPKETAIVGDRMSREIKAGNLLGCKTFWIQQGDRSFDKPTEETGQPNYTINSIKDLSNFV